MQLKTYDYSKIQTDITFPRNLFFQNPNIKDNKPYKTMNAGQATADKTVPVLRFRPMGENATSGYFLKRKKAA